MVLGFPNSQPTGLPVMSDEVVLRVLALNLPSTEKSRIKLNAEVIGAIMIQDGCHVYSVTQKHVLTCQDQLIVEIHGLQGVTLAAEIAPQRRIEGMLTAYVSSPSNTRTLLHPRGAFGVEKSTRYVHDFSATQSVSSSLSSKKGSGILASLASDSR